jgi:hypothetical protein
MNLLLYIEARQTLARQRGETSVARPVGSGEPEPLPALPDALFEELGYYGAIEDQKTPESNPVDLDDLFQWFSEPVLNLQNG